MSDHLRKNNFNLNLFYLIFLKNCDEEYDEECNDKKYHVKKMIFLLEKARDIRDISIFITFSVAFWFKASNYFHLPFSSIRSTYECCLTNKPLM